MRGGVLLQEGCKGARSSLRWGEECVGSLQPGHPDLQGCTAAGLPAATLQDRRGCRLLIRSPVSITIHYSLHHIMLLQEPGSAT